MSPPRSLRFLPRTIGFSLVFVLCLRAAEEPIRLNPFEVSGDSASAARVLEEVESEGRSWQVQPPGNSTEALLKFVVVSGSFCLSGAIWKMDANGKHTGGVVTIKREEMISRGDILRNAPPEYRKSERSLTLSVQQAAVVHGWFTQAGFLDPKTRPAVGTRGFDGNPVYVETVKDGQKLGFFRDPDSADPFWVEVRRFELWTRPP